MQIRRSGLQLRSPLVQWRLYRNLWIVATSLLLPSCAPDPSNQSASLADKFFRQVAHEISPALYAKLGPPPIPVSRNQSVALVFLDGGMPPPIPACAADLKADLERQLTLLAARSGIRLRLTSNLDEAAVVIAIGDTLHEYGIKDPLLDALMDARQGPDGATSTHSHDFGFPGFPSPDFLGGVFSSSSDRLLFGALRIQWNVTVREVTKPGGVKGKDCTFDFIARLARLYSLALNDDLRSEYGNAWSAARTRTDISAYQVPNTGLEEHLGIYFCAQFVGVAELADCSAQVVKLMTNRSR